MPTDNYAEPRPDERSIYCCPGLENRETWGTRHASKILAVLGSIEPGQLAHVH